MNCSDVAKLGKILIQTKKIIEYFLLFLILTDIDYGVGTNKRVY